MNFHNDSMNDSNIKDSFKDSQMLDSVKDSQRDSVKEESATNIF